MSKRKNGVWIGISILLAIVIALSATVSFVETNVQRDFCVIYEGKKLLTDVNTFTLAPENAEFKVQTLEGDPITDFSVSVKAAKVKDDFGVRFNDVDELLWSDYVEADVDFSGACAVTKSGGTFTVAQTRIPKIFANMYPTTDVDLSALTTCKNLFEIVVTVDRQSIGIKYYVKVGVEGVRLSDNEVEFGV